MLEYTPTFSNLVIFHTYPPMKMEQIECSETTAYKIQTLGNYTEESIQHCFKWFSYKLTQEYRGKIYFYFLAYGKV